MSLTTNKYSQVGPNKVLKQHQPSTASNADYSAVFTAEPYAIHATIKQIRNKYITDRPIKVLQSLNRANHYLIAWIKQLFMKCMGIITIE